MTDHGYYEPPYVREPLNIGHSENYCEAMHREGQRLVSFNVVFERLSTTPDTQDYRSCLARLWSAFLVRSGLSATIAHPSWSPDGGLSPAAVGWVWRQHGTECLATMTDQELHRLGELLRTRDSRVVSFTLTERFSTDKFRINRRERTLRFRDGNFFIEPPS